MSAVAEHPPITAEDLLALRDGDRFELVNGELVERNIGWESEWIGTNLIVLLGTYCHQRGLGWVNGSNASYWCFADIVPDDPGRVRKPDVSFIARERLSGDRLPTGHCEVAPDFAAEVVSPHDLYGEVEEKIDEYLRAGVRLVWVIDPRTKSVRIHRADGTLQDVRDDGELSGEAVIPGFRCAVRQLFAVPATETIP